MRSFILMAGLLAAAPLVHGAGEPAIPSSHPVVGTWTWAQFGGTCTETYQYRPDRSMRSISGQEVAEKRYEVAATPDSQGFYKLVQTVIRQNGKKDCSGAQLEGPGEKTTGFLQFSPQRDKLLVCQAQSLKACFGPLQRVP